MNTLSESIVVRPIINRDELNEVYRLTHETYLEQGYCRPQSNGMLIHYPHLDISRNTTVYIALSHGVIVGTISVTEDGPQGLHIDVDYKPICDQIRAEGLKMASVWRIATKSDIRDNCRMVMQLIGAAVSHVLEHNLMITLYIFHRRHERVYQRILNMKTIGFSNESATGLLNCPTVLMRLDLGDMPERWAKNELEIQTIRRAKAILETHRAA